MINERSPEAPATQPQSAPACQRSCSDGAKLCASFLQNAPFCTILHRCASRLFTSRPGPYLRSQHETTTKSPRLLQSTQIPKIPLNCRDPNKDILISEAAISLFGMMGQTARMLTYTVPAWAMEGQCVCGARLAPLSDKATLSKSEESGDPGDVQRRDNSQQGLPRTIIVTHVQQGRGEQAETARTTGASQIPG
ncbi:hypothetical protein ElyMa_004062500 [Elysia marginata]|uniref:Uncharacterized protein n=1 Tax=Elysia marginata TaxID=1093978 RepID=A0AAV4G7J2_9GAST|nr:hypothetical protein ElyMa_004062500 [Elysia marginata]